MALDLNKYVAEVRKFTDPEFKDFTEFPKTIPQAKQKWADAFQTFINDLEVIAPPTVSPNNVQAQVSSCGPAFLSKFDIDNNKGTTPAKSAKIYADAWEMAMLSIILIPGGEYLGVGSLSNILTIIPLTLIPTQKAILLTTLIPIFTNIQSTAEIQITQIVTAFYTATIGSLTTTCLHKNPAFPPPPPILGPFPIVFG